MDHGLVCLLRFIFMFCYLSGRETVFCVDVRVSGLDKIGERGGYKNCGVICIQTATKHTPPTNHAVRLRAASHHRDQPRMRRGGRPRPNGTGASV